MKKVIKIAAITLVLLLITLVALPFVFSSKIEAAVKSAVNENVNAEVNWTDYSLTLFSDFPNATVTLDSLEILGKGEFENEHLADIPKTEVSLDIMSLFSENAKVNAFKLVDPYIYIHVKESGAANYDIAIPSETEDEENEPVGAFKMAVDHYEIDNGTFSYLDEAGGMMIYLENFDHEGEGDFTASEFTLETKTKSEEFDFIFDDIAYINKAVADIDADIKIDLDNMRFDIEGNEILLNDLKLVAEGFVEMPTDDIKIDIEYNAPETNIKQLVSMVPAEFTGDLKGVNAKGALMLDGFVKGIYNENSMPAIGLDINVADGFLKYPDLPESIADILLDAHFLIPEGNNMDDMTIDVNQFKMSIAGNPIDAQFHFTQPFTKQFLDATLKTNLDFESLSKACPLDNTNLNGKLNADVVFKGNILDVMEQNYSNFIAKGLVDVENMNVDASDTYKMDIEKAHFDLSPSTINMTSFIGKIGESDFNATGQIMNFLPYAFDGEMLKGDFSFSSQNMNMTDFMTTEDGESDGSEETESYVDVPENLDFKLNADIKKLTYDGTVLDNLKGAINVLDGTAAMKDVNLNFLGGSIKLDGSYTTKDTDSPVLDMKYVMNNLDIAKTSESFDLISLLAPVAKYCEGKFGSTLSLTTNLGKDMFPVYESISAAGKVNTNTVQVENFKPLTEIANKLNWSGFASQSLKNLNMNFSVKDGAVSVKPFDLKLNGVNANVSGSTNFSQEMDYVIKMDIPFSKLPQQGGELVNDILGRVNQLGTNFSSNQIIPLTIKVTGTITQPKLNLSDLGSGMVTDIKEEVKEQVTQLVEDKVTEVKEDVTENLQAKADEIMSQANTLAEKTRKDGIDLANKGKDEAYKAAQRLEDEAKKPWEKLAAKLAADKARKKADETHAKAVAKTNEKADKIISDAQEKANTILGN